MQKVVPESVIQSSPSREKLRAFRGRLKRAGNALVDLTVDQWFNLRPTRRRQQAFIRRTLASQRVPRTRRIIVSLSTLPERIDRLQPTLESLLAQTRPPDEIVLAIPEFSVRQNRAYRIPPFLASIPQLRVLRSEVDWGPATKFIPVVQSELLAGRGDTLVMVVDDDRVYPRDSIELYLHYGLQFPDAALTFRGGPIPPSLNWRESKLIYGVDVQRPEPIAVINGCGSYLIQPRFFNKDLWDYSAAPAGAFYMDDIWISGCLDRRGVKKFVIPAARMTRGVVSQFWAMTLHEVPNGRLHNNNEAIAFFRDTWNVFLSRP